MASGGNLLLNFLVRLIALAAEETGTAAEETDTDRPVNLNGKF
jgi:hypothetical protein